eukprot:scaffold18678_cov128-Isochrysis_galbana.AAC.5
MLAWRAGGMVAGALGVYAFSRFLWMDTNAQRAKPARIYSAEGHARPTSTGDGSQQMALRACVCLDTAPPCLQLLHAGPGGVAGTLQAGCVATASDR